MLLAHPKEEKKAHLLCVDDDLSFLLGFTAVLQAAGYSVVATSDPNKLLISQKMHRSIWSLSTMKCHT